MKIKKWSDKNKMLSKKCRFNNICEGYRKSSFICNSRGSLECGKFRQYSSLSKKCLKKIITKDKKEQEIYSNSVDLKLLSNVEKSIANEELSKDLDSFNKGK